MTCDDGRIVCQATIEACYNTSKLLTNTVVQQPLLCIVAKTIHLVEHLEMRVTPKQHKKPALHNATHK